MNKTTVLVILVGVAIGVAICLFTNWNPITTFQSFIANPQEYLQSIIPTVQQHYQTILAGLSGFGVTLGIANKAYNKTKQEAKETANILNSQISKLKTDHEQEKAKLEGQIQTLKEQTNNPTLELQEAQTLVTKQATTITKQKASIDELHRALENLERKEVVKTVVK